MLHVQTAFRLSRLRFVSIGQSSERSAARADRFAVIRSLHHHEAPVHETGRRMLQIGPPGNTTLPDDTARRAPECASS